MKRNIHVHLSSTRVVGDRCPSICKKKNMVNTHAQWRLSLFIAVDEATIGICHV